MDLSFIYASLTIRLVESTIYHQRIPLFLGMKFYPIKSPEFNDFIWFYFLFGSEISLDTIKPSTTTDSKQSRIAVGLVVGLGVELPLTSLLSLNFSGRYHMIKDSYFDGSLGLGFHF